MPRPVVYMDLSIGSSAAGRVLFELFSDTVPRTAENFRQLCTGEGGVGKSSGKRLHFLGCAFHRVIPGFMMQGGDFTAGDGTGGESVYGRTFRDEDLSAQHSTAGLLSMANAGPHTNGSQFFVLFRPAPHLDGKHVVFGRVVSGMDVVRAVERVPTGSGDRPKSAVVVSSCGELSPDEAAALTASAPSTSTRSAVLEASGAEGTGAAAAARRRGEPEWMVEARLMGVPRQSEGSDGDGATFTNQLAAEARGTEESLGDFIRQQLQQKEQAKAEKLRAAMAAAAGDARGGPADAGAQPTAETASPAGSASAASKAAADAAAAAPAPAPAPSAKVSAAQARLAALRDRAKAGRRETSKEAYFEARRGAGLDTERMRAGKRRRDEAAGGEERDVADAVLDLDASTAREAAYKEEIKAKRAREHFGWAQHNGRMEREYARDVAALPAGSAAALAAAASGEASAGRVAEAVVPHLASDSRHGAADFADPARVEALAGRIEGKISSGVGRTRKVRQDEAPTYINDRNRRMNLMLERHYGKFAAETKESFERGTAL
ncbi:hypothetical protein FNF29_07598 [Cafeteria roenbergensis]|uniref:peptidylprolyl isomerase n=1 Tax=Cafeteria roenbergensis TaxID=33653 RepID=A0A5A8C2F7_CAFRO|nr:hypothetical protein FNF29_07598 [Cafeteria roenbergensis]|eukprot:KAA0147108.1 hypothetical protein FNF29_07598 [Cafeteria roenbergensis]